VYQWWCDDAWCDCDEWHKLWKSIFCEKNKMTFDPKLTVSGAHSKDIFSKDRVEKDSHQKIYQGPILNELELA
jgi:hypothetical protein